MPNKPLISIVIPVDSSKISTVGTSVEMRLDKSNTIWSFYHISTIILVVDYCNGGVIMHL